MTGAPHPSDTLLDTVLQILREAGKALSPADIRKVLQAKGMSRLAADNAWVAVQKDVKAHEFVAIEGSRYRWIADELAELSPAEALELLLEDGLAGPRRTALVKVIRAALSVPSKKDNPEDAARRRQSEIDSARRLAELASEVEELIANETEPPVMIRQVRAWVKRSGLDPVGQAGETTRFDRKKHQSIVGRIRDGASVVVVRPGYIWKRGSEEDVLLGKAVVEE